MKTAAAALAFTLLAAGAAAQTPQLPPLLAGPPETIYSDADRARDDALSRRFVQSLMKPSFSLEGQFSRWKTPVCPKVIGLTPLAAHVVEKRIRDVAAQIGAPLNRADPCNPNIRVFVSPEPQATLDAIAAKEIMLFEGSPMRELKLRYPVQSWQFGYVVDFYGNRMLDIDCFLHDPADCGFVKDPFGSRLRNGFKSELAATTILADVGAIKGMSLGTLGDYLALMSLAPTPAAGRCQPAPSIANLFLKDCGADFFVTELSEADLAMLKALYETESEPEKLQMMRLMGNMRKNLEGEHRK